LGHSLIEFPSSIRSAAYGKTIGDAPPRPTGFWSLVARKPWYPGEFLMWVGLPTF